MFRIAVFFIIILLVSGQLAYSQVMLWVEFTDKKYSPYCISRPEEFLSARAIERRKRDNIAVELYDLPVSQHYLNQIRQIGGVSVFYTSRWFNGALLSISDTTIKGQIRELKFVRLIEVAKPERPDKSNNHHPHRTTHSNISMMSFAMPEGVDRGEVHHSFSGELRTYWNVYPEYGKARNQIELVNGQNLHKKGFWGHGKIIAVFDSGFLNADTLEAFSHLMSNGKILGTKDFVLPGGDVFRTHPHGTSVLSVMGGLLDNVYAGASLGASYWLLRTEDAESEFRIEEYNWLAGAEFADSVGADIISSSLGYTRFDDDSQNYTIHDLNGVTTVVARAANKAASRGILVVSSAGNYGNQNWRRIGSPADAHGALAVGATDAEGNRTSFSSVGHTADGRIKPDVMAQGSAVSSINARGNIGNAHGTSFAAPMIAGLAACLWQAFPDISNYKLKSAIRQSSSTYIAPDSLYGFGIPDFQKAYDILSNKAVSQYEAKIRLAINPITPDSYLLVNSNYDDAISIEIINSTGQRVFYIKGVLVNKGLNKISPFTNIGELASGVYIIRVTLRDHYQLIKAVRL